MLYMRLVDPFETVPLYQFDDPPEAGLHIERQGLKFFPNTVVEKFYDPCHQYIVLQICNVYKCGFYPVCSSSTSKNYPLLRSIADYGTHKVAKIRSWLARHPRYQVHFTPTSASWLNLVERLFAELTERCVRRGSHTAVRVLEKAMLDYLNQRNQHPKPFIWTADADLILGKVERLCKRISRSGH